MLVIDSSSAQSQRPTTEGHAPVLHHCAWMNTMRLNLTYHFAFDESVGMA